MSLSTLLSPDDPPADTAAFAPPRLPEQPDAGEYDELAGWCDETESHLTLRARHYAVGTVVVHVAGALDHHTTDRLALLLQPRLECVATTMILDLSRVNFVGTAALELLLHARDQATHRGMRLRLVDGPTCLRRALRAATYLGAEPFATYPDLPTALGHTPHSAEEGMQP